MHCRPFFFAAFFSVVALVVSSLPGVAQEEASAPKAKAGLLQTLEDLVQAQSKQIGELGAKLDQANAALEVQGKVLVQQSARLDALNQAVAGLSAASRERVVATLPARPRMEGPAQMDAPRPLNAAPTVETALPAPAPTVQTPETAGVAVPAASSTEHIVKQGETLVSIARQHKTTVALLMQLNKIEDARKLQIGQTLLLPQTPE